jgi:hypothetical protein
MTRMNFRDKCGLQADRRRGHVWVMASIKIPTPCNPLIPASIPTFADCRPAEPTHAAVQSCVREVPMSKTLNLDSRGTCPHSSHPTHAVHQPFLLGLIFVISQRAGNSAICRDPKDEYDKQWGKDTFSEGTYK